jgi:hypothetical protein
MERERATAKWPLMVCNNCGMCVMIAWREGWAAEVGAKIAIHDDCGGGNWIKSDVETTNTGWIWDLECACYQARKQALGLPKVVELVKKGSLKTPFDYVGGIGKK